MFKSFFKKNDDEDIFETVDPIVEKRRNEKFSKPLIYDEEFKDKENHEKKEEKRPLKEEKKVVKKEVKIAPKVDPEKKAYEMMDVISPMFGLSEDKKTKETSKKTPVKTSKKKKKRDNSLIQVISPYYGNFDEDIEDEGDDEAVLTASEKTTEKKEPQSIEDVPTVEDNLRNIAKIVEEEQDQLKIIEERPGEFKLDFGTHSTQKQGSLIDEIDDNMSLDELMNLYEKKFKD